MSPEDQEFYVTYWLQELIAWGIHNGISKRSMMNDYYPEEILAIRKMVEMHKARDAMVLLSIVNNPHTKDPRALHDSLARMCGPGIADGAYWSKTKLNKSQFEQLRSAMSRSQAARRGR
jgi:hypothetical protein